MHNKIIKLSLALLLLSGISGLFVWWLQLPVKQVMVMIPPGTSAQQIAQLLTEKKIISSRFVFLQTIKLTGKAKHLKAGAYLLSPRDSLFKVIRTITSGKAQYIRVTVPEGFTSRQIAEVLSRNGVTDGETFLRMVTEGKREGYLFPETYYFEQNTPPEKVIDKMNGEYSNHFTEEMKLRAQELKMTEHKIVTLASIIEKEAVRAEERPRIAGVFYNRLKKNWYLESCATVLYALGKHKEKLLLKDLKTDSPYNTYRRFGLPPGPICNPGIASIQAALYPMNTEDMFFVASSSGAHSFSRYFSDHVTKKNKKRQGKSIESKAVLESR